MNGTGTSLTNGINDLVFQMEIPSAKLLLTREQMEQAMVRFHFPSENLDEFMQLQEELGKVLQCKGILLSLPDQMRQGGVPYGKFVLHRQDTMLGAITLGKEYDRLQQDYTTRQQIGQAYRLETLGMEYLRQAYQLFNAAVGENGLGFPGEYHYLETQQQLQQACVYLEEKDFTAITCNKYGVLVPSKSVLFRTALKQKAPGECGNTCAGCPALQCSFRQTRQIQNH